MTELYFRAPSRKSYAQGLGLSLIGIGCLAWGVVTLAITPWSLAGILPLAGGVFLVLLGVAFTLFVWFMFAYGMVTAWRDWRQFRVPDAVISSAGVRYLAPRRPVLVPWPDIEEVAVKHTLLSKNNVVTKVSLRLSTGAASLRDGLVHVSASRSLNVGLASDADVSESALLQFLADTAGDRLKITEVDRRSSSVDSRAP